MVVTFAVPTTHKSSPYKMTFQSHFYGGLHLISVHQYFPKQSTSCSLYESTKVRKLQVRSYTMSLAWYQSMTYFRNSLAIRLES